MATESIPKQTFIVRNLQTRSVTLYPTKAHIIRAINGISLKPGANQIIIEGLTPTVDEHSIKVEGTGAATITDLSVELLPNKELFEDIYPSDDEDEDEDEEDDEEVAEEAAVEAVTAEIKKLNIQLEDARERGNSATSRLEILEKSIESVPESRPTNLEHFIAEYKAERSKIALDIAESAATIEDLDTKIVAAEKKKDRLGKAALKAMQKRLKEKAKKLEKKNRKKQETLREKARIREERVKFWPKKVFNITLSLDAPSSFTPAVSRRESMESLVKVPAASESSFQASEVPTEVNLLLSYITYSASWSPRYDLSLNTVTNSGALDYQAELRNTTSETWRDAKVVLSTSVSSYQGLGDTIPVMQPWHVRLVKPGYANGQTGGLYSAYEQTQAAKNRQEIPAQVWAPRNELFGLERGGGASKEFYSQYDEPSLSKPRGGPPAPPMPLMSQQYHVNMQQKQDSNFPYAASKSSAPKPLAGSLGGEFGGKGMKKAKEWRRSSAAADGAFGGMGHSVMAEEAEDSSGEEGGFGGFDESTLAGVDHALLFEESSFEESGLTTTYDVPTLKTLGPTSTTTKHKIARIDFKGITFSHILIPKLKASAFLKARLRNASKITLLKGTAGLTLDGSFMGQSTIPRCSAGDSFTLPLGVDPTITVSYSKPTVRRSQSGIFNKEDCEVFTRTVVITNTKHNAAVEMQILDQVPVSEDERLRIEIVNPPGLRIAGQGVPTGIAMTATGDVPAQAVRTETNTGSIRNSIYKDAVGKPKEAIKWGSAIATAKKGGEVNWAVKINPLKSCKLVLEYEAIRPGGEVVIGV